MTPESFLDMAKTIAVALVSVAFLVAIIRLMIGPTLSDRVLSVDMLVTSGIGFVAVIAIMTGYYQYLDVAIGLGLVGFLATVAFARYILARGDPTQADQKGRDAASSKARPGESP